MSRYGRKPMPVTYAVDARGCHVCTSHSRRSGRPQIALTVDGRRRCLLLARWLWEQKHGRVPADRKLFHNCRNPACIRLDHLEPLTAEEIGERVKIVGEEHPASKLTAEQVALIRAAPDEKAARALAERFGVCRTYARQIRTGCTWKHVGGPVQPARDFRPAIMRGRALLAMREAAGVTAVEVARRAGIHFTAVSRIEHERAVFTRDTEERYLAALAAETH